MKTIVQCPYCNSCNTEKTANGKLSDGLAKAGAVVGGALLQMVTGINGTGLLGANVGYGQTWHQYCCHDCHESFKVKLSTLGTVKEIKKY